MSATSSPRKTLLRLLGPEVSALLADPEVTELYTVEGDWFLCVDSLGSGRRRSGIELPAERAEMLLNAVASFRGVSFGPGMPVLAAELPDSR